MRRIFLILQEGGPFYFFGSLFAPRLLARKMQNEILPVALFFLIPPCKLKNVAPYCNL